MSEVRFVPFDRSHVEGLEEIFRSNVGIWFADNEIKDLHRHFDSHEQMSGGGDLHGWTSFYDVLLVDNEIVGAGGVMAKGELGELSWGMVHNRFHKQGYGKLLIEHRIEKTKIEWPNVRSLLSQTTPAAAGFFAKHGFLEKLRQPNYWGGELELVGLEFSFDGTSRYQHPDNW